MYISWLLTEFSETTSEFLRTPSPESINSDEFPKPPSLTNSGNFKEKTGDLLPLSPQVTFWWIMLITIILLMSESKTFFFQHSGDCSPIEILRKSVSSPTENDQCRTSVESDHPSPALLGLFFYSQRSFFLNIFPQFLVRRNSSLINNPPSQARDLDSDSFSTMGR